MRSGAMRRKRGLSASITAVHIMAELAEPCSNSTGGPEPAMSTALRRIGRAVLIQRFREHAARMKRGVIRGQLIRGSGPGFRFAPSGLQALLRRHARGGIDALDLGGAELEFGDFAE